MKNLVTIRKAHKSDAVQLIEHTKKVLSENAHFLSSTLEEFSTTVEEEEEWINAHDSNGLVLVAEVNSEIVGMLNFRRSTRKKFCHQGMFGMSVQEQFSDNGIGSSLLTELLDWAKENEVEKVSLEVFSNNPRAFHLYSKFGFTVEGRRVRQGKLGPNEYVDDILMGKFL
ncbi:GNAT family N-acetyltransferase [Alkalihalobacillus sp. CinArs1]|uniref:GNAT family N-acetyltransferase n=1 Tax=Alkalihalobacillus sp. CinArs1 TaxID=2995314 RepID=UPI0022DE8F7A|nr:GNAT family N-acetyltransferase [Alkalihalobacillus sp. CinArs1]